MRRIVHITILVLLCSLVSALCWAVDYSGAPWVKRASRPYRVERGLDGRHLSVWASHGRYFDGTKNAWRWQRPYLFCTTEDLLTQSFVYPYLIPMLENAGAVVFTPRERDYQVQESIVDNDTPRLNGGYAEVGSWSDAGSGFGMNFTCLNDTVMPFTLGTVRKMAANSGAMAIWTPEIPETGRYAVYVSYSTIPESVSDAHYTVCHAGGVSHFIVNQQMGGGTWVYLGTFLFEEGQSERNRVILTSQSDFSDSDGSPRFVTADAVRFGGGRGNAERSNPEVTTSFVQRQVTEAVPVDSASSIMTAGDGRSSASASLPDLSAEFVKRDTLVTDTLYHYHFGPGISSNMPRYLEAARYYTQWAGLPDTLYAHYHGQDDYKDDLRSRSYLLNLLGGGSCYQPDTIGRGVPFELQLALHTDAGYSRDGNLTGSLTIATEYDDEGRRSFRSGLSREFSKKFAAHVLEEVGHDLSRLYGVTWPQRQCRIANYAETRSPQVPSTILELLAHQNFYDMKFAHDPNFKFHASRAIYKVMLREVYRMHSLGEPVIQPLPVQNMSVTLLDRLAHLSWTPQTDSLEPSAVPTSYVLYVRQDKNDWDEGTLIAAQPEVNVTILPGVHYQFRISALNAGGESFPSEPVSIYLSPTHTTSKTDEVTSKADKVLVVNGFDRISGPAWVETKDSLGFDLRQDVGVSNGVNTSFCGEQIIFDATAMGKEGPSSLGFSGIEYTGVPLSGNLFDGIALHTDDIIAARPSQTVVSMSHGAFAQLSPEQLSEYSVIDYIGGLQADRPYNLRPYQPMSEATRQLLAAYQQQGGSLLISGAHIGETDSLFLATTLHAVRYGSSNHYDGGTFNGLGLDIPVYNRPNALHYPCQHSDIVIPADATAFSAFAYSALGDTPGYSAGIAWPGGLYMAFPYDCIADPDIRRKVMTTVLQYLQPAK